MIPEQILTSSIGTGNKERKKKKKEKLQLISSKFTALGVIGGGSIMTDHGSLRINLGPREDRKYHEITAIGMRNVTAGFGKYNLEEIGQECKATATPTEMDFILL